MEDEWYMRRALDLAALGQGAVEPNPMVGCVVAQGSEIVGEGYHAAFGGAHAEVAALDGCTGGVRGATLYVTLEPCCHQGKTPPCTGAIIRSGVRRVVAAMEDPFPQVAGDGFRALLEAGIEVEVGLLGEEARALNAPYLKLRATGRPWVIAKWAMTLDGKIATTTGESRWITGEAAREITHRLRGRVDAIAVGRGTAEADDPLLMARPAGARQATRIVLDSHAALALESQLVRTSRESRVMVVVGPQAPADVRRRLEAAGCEVLAIDAADPLDRLDQWLLELGRRRMTNVLVEGGGKLLGSLLDRGHIDEVHAFIAPKLVGGATAPTPIAGRGRSLLAECLELDSPEITPCGADVYICGRVRKGQ